MGKTQNNLDLPVYLFHQGNNSKAYEIMGSHKVPGTDQVVFRVWAPHATAVSVVGDFNDWDPYNLRMEKISDGIWEATAPDGAIEEYSAYKYAIEARDGRTIMKADPYGYHMETRPGTASKFYDIDDCYTWNDDEWLEHRASTRIYDMPVNIYEVHAGSWKVYEDGNLYSYRALADELDINTGFILDGGGSTDIVVLDEGEYKVLNKPSDGRERNVENSVILSYGPKRETSGTYISPTEAPESFTSLFFSDRTAFSMLMCNTQTKMTATSEGALIQADKYNGDGFFNIRFGYPQTTSVNPDPAYKFDYPTIDIDEYPYIVLDIKAQTTDASAFQFQTVYVSAGDDWSASGNNFIGFNNVFNDGQFHRYVIDTTSNSKVTGQLNLIRIGYLMPLNGVVVSDGDGIVLRSVRFARTAQEAQQLVNQPFSDVVAGKWYSEAVGYCYMNGYMSGTSSTAFSPNVGVTRAMFATILATLEGADLTSYNVKAFDDVDTGRWYSAPIAWASANGLAAGIGNGKFGPNATVTREQIATFLLTFAKYQDRSPNSRANISAYSDYSSIHSWAREGMSWAVARGLISGTSATTLSPLATATRSQIALIVMNYAK